MGQVISLAEHRAARARAGGEAPSPRASTFWFDLGSPFTYLAAERVERLLPGVEWRPVAGEGEAVTPTGTVRAGVERRAAALRLPLVWPENPDAPARAAMRVAHFAAERGSAAAFVLAASRLAYCGGFDLADPETLAEAAAAANLALEDCLAAAGDSRRDVALRAAADDLRARGADRLPAFSVHGRLLCGESRLAEAAAARVRSRRPAAAPEAG